MDATWTISELGERVSEALAEGVELPGGKARAVPDERAIRYYTTLGLIDRPTLKGRTAYYGPRHLAQLIAIKRMQVEGATLAQIQELLPALEDARLSELTGVALPARERPAARRDFWRATPDAAADAATTADSETREPSQGPRPEARGPRPAPAAPAALAGLAELAETAEPLPAFTTEHHLELAPGVRLSIHAARVPTDADADALRVAAAAVLAELTRRRLVTPRQP